MVRRPGGLGALELDRTPLPPPRAGEACVSVRACGVNFADTAVRLGLYAAARGQYPVCPGLEFSGVVREVGSGVEAFRPGDRVFGVTRFGGYATALNVPAEQLWLLPGGWGFERGAAFPVAYLTAAYGLFHVAHARPEDAVLVHSAAGGVGTALLHLLTVAGSSAAVGVVGRTDKVAAAEKAGASAVIDKSRQDLWRTARSLRPEGFDIVLDANGASTLRGSFRHLAPGGRLLVYGFASMLDRSSRRNPVKLLWTYLRTPRFDPLRLTGTNRSVCGFNLIHLFDRKALFHRVMRDLLDWDAQGRLPDMPVTAFPFSEARQAHRWIGSGGSTGKLVLAVDPAGAGG